MKWFVTISLICVCQILHAQKLGYTSAVITKKNGDSLKCLLPIATAYEDAIEYTEAGSPRVYVIKAKDVAAIKTELQLFENVPYKKKEVIMSLVTKGDVKLFRWMKKYDEPAFTSGGITLFAPPTIEYVVKKNGSYMEITEKNYVEVMSDVLRDCPIIVTRLNNEYYEYATLENVVKDFYNCNDPSAFSVKYDRSLFGTWKSDTKDEATKNSIGDAKMKFSDDGSLIYDIVDGVNVQRMKMKFHARRDTLFYSQPPDVSEQSMKYEYKDNKKILILEFNGIKTVFRREGVELLKK